ncbi:MAG: DUF5519 family protein [Gemmatimonadaceae bacterium]|nr:DUF5519 family protein [Gemmatimonadaceae bacterium]
MSKGDRDGVVAQVRQAVTAFDGVQERPHRGHARGWEFVLDDTELGHVHDDGAVHVLLPRRERDHLVHAGLAAPLRYAPRSGWVEFIPTCEDDALAAAAIFRRAWQSRARRRVAAVA